MGIEYIPAFRTTTIKLAEPADVTVLKTKNLNQRLFIIHQNIV